MISFIKIACKSSFFVFTEYEYLRFYKFDGSSSFPNIALRPEYEHYGVYEELTGKQAEGKLTGFAGVLTATPKALSEFKDLKKFRTYNPLDDTPELFTELAKVQLLDEKSLLKFTMNYGLPSPIRFVNPFEDSYLLNDSVNIVIHEMDTLLFYQKLKEYKKIFNLWVAIKNNNLAELEKTKREFEEFANSVKQESEQKQSDEIFDSMRFTNLQDAYLDEQNNSMIEHSVWQIWQQIKNKSLIEIANHYLILLLNNHEHGKPTFDYVNGQVVPSIHFGSPLEVAYYQLSRAIVNNIELRECDYCHHLFEVTHEGRRFCPPLPGRKRSTCENTYNQRLKRQRQKQRKEKK